jgi:hypothetical protein
VVDPQGAVPHQFEVPDTAEGWGQQKKAQGKTHATALRDLGQRWLKILSRMWHDKVPYNEALHMQSLANSGSWVLGLVPAAQELAADARRIRHRLRCALRLPFSC